MPLSKKDLLDKLIYDPNKYDYIEKIRLVKSKQFLAPLARDNDYKVRKAVAHEGYYLGVLVNDKDWRVRGAALNAINRLIKDGKKLTITVEGI